MSLRRLLNVIPEGAKRGWRLLVNGAEVPAQLAELVSDRFGSIVYGWNGQYDTWGFEEVGGGGSVLVPYFEDEEGMLWIGLVQQPRPFMSTEPVWNLPRGFLSLGENHFQSMVRESGEELGFEEADRVRSLRGEPGNPNSTFFVTVGENPDGSPKGIKFYCVLFSQSELEWDGSNFRFKPGVVKPLTPSAEKIMGMTFMPWDLAMKLPCLITVAGIGRLLATQSEEELEVG